MSSIELFFPLTKVDETRRLVYGLATAEREDLAGEICDYETTKPYYERWSQEIQKATDGKSLGNVRAMHSNIAAGKITSLVFHDKEKQIEICAKVVDDDEWKKVCEGVYTGFSQGGTYVKRWSDPSGAIRYTANPIEISLVDLPCLPDATFQIVKDGAVESRSFRTTQAPAEAETVLRSRRDGSLFASVEALRRHHARLDAQEGLDKRGARHSQTDQDNLQAAHDALVAAGARCPGASAPACDDGSGADDSDAQKVHAGAFQKSFDRLANEGAALRKDLALIAEVLDEVLERVKTIERQPNPPPFPAGVRAVSKTQDGRPGAGQADLAEIYQANSEELALEAIKLAHRNPIPLAAKR